MTYSIFLYYCKAVWIFSPLLANHFTDHFACSLGLVLHIPRCSLGTQARESGCQSLSGAKDMHGVRVSLATLLLVQ